MYKPIDLVTQYGVDFEKHPVVVNKNITSFIERYSFFMTHKHQAYNNLSKYSESPSESAVFIEDQTPVDSAMLAI